MKITLLLASFALTAGLASASIVYTSPCSVLMTPNTSGNTGTSCSATPDAGFVLDSLTLTIEDDYTGWQNGNPTVSFSGTLTQSFAVFTAPIFCDVTTTSKSSNPCAVTITPSATVTGLSLLSYTITITNAGNSVASGSVTGASEVMTLSATESAITGAPEPATFGIMGAALVGLAIVARKRKA